MRPEETGGLGRTSKSLAQSACPQQGSSDGHSARTGGPSSLVGWPHGQTMDCFSRRRTNLPWTSPVVQWMRIRLWGQAVRVQSPVQGGPTCLGATKPRCHNDRAHALEPVSHGSWGPGPWSLCSTGREATSVSGPRAPQLGKAHATAKALHSRT